eukprot:4899948-Prymnesium_polylepis.1
MSSATCVYAPSAATSRGSTHRPLPSPLPQPSWPSLLTEAAAGWFAFGLHCVDRKVLPGLDAAVYRQALVDHVERRVIIERRRQPGQRVQKLLLVASAAHVLMSARSLRLPARQSVRAALGRQQRDRRRRRQARHHAPLPIDEP